MANNLYARAVGKMCDQWFAFVPHFVWYFSILHFCRSLNSLICTSFSFGCLWKFICAVVKWQAFVPSSRDFISILIFFFHVFFFFNFSCCCCACIFRVNFIRVRPINCCLCAVWSFGNCAWNIFTLIVLCHCCSMLINSSRRNHFAFVVTKATLFFFHFSRTVAKCHQFTPTDSISLFSLSKQNDKHINLFVGHSCLLTQWWALTNSRYCRLQSRALKLLLTQYHN